MSDKFASYYNTPEKIEELSEYVYLNFKLIQTKMISEMRRKLNITPDLQYSDGYVSLMSTLHVRMFNEVVYSLCGLCQSLNMEATEILPPMTMIIILNLFKGENALQGHKRTDVKEDLDGFKKYYLENIDELRKHIEALPK